MNWGGHMVRIGETKINREFRQKPMEKLPL
jgi:hypothetical protein